MTWCVFALLSSAALSSAVARSHPVTRAAADDLVVDLPGLGSLGDSYNQYSGYLDGGNGKLLHYWSVEWQTPPLLVGGMANASTTRRWNGKRLHY